MISANQIRPGMIIIYNGDLHRVMNVHHLTPGNKRALVQAEMRNVKTGVKTENRFRSEDKVEKAVMEEYEMEFLYNSGEDYHFMNTESYEQTHLSAELIGNGTAFLQPNTKVKVLFWEGQPLGLDLPQNMNLKVTETDPPMKGATASSSYKPAKLENGVSTKVPPFINVGDMIKIDTTSLEYIERV